MLTIVVFLWHTPGYRSVFTPKIVNIHYAMLKRNYSSPFRYVCVTNHNREGLNAEIETFPLWDDWADVPSPHGYGLPSCYRRLKLFDPETARAIGDRIAWLDLDMVICADVTDIFDRREPLVVLRTNFNKSPLNGSMLMMDAGARPDIWQDFTPAGGIKARDAGCFGSDQGWIAYKLRNEPHLAHWRIGQGGIYARRDLFRSRRKPAASPSNAKIVLFMGKPDPWEEEAQRYPLVRAHYGETVNPIAQDELETLNEQARARYQHLQAISPVKRKTPNADRMSGPA